MTIRGLFSIFNSFPEISVVMSSKDEGQMKMRENLQRDEKTLENRERFMKKQGIFPKAVVSGGLIHSNKVVVVDRSYGGQFIADTDSLITTQPNVFLSFTVADCLPIFIYDPENKVIALVHVGWRGLLKGVLSKTINQLKSNSKVKPENLIVGVGPGIGPCHFEIKKDILAQFNNHKYAIRNRNGKYFVDLKEIVLQELLKQGVKRENIEINPECTFCESEKYMSYRRDKTDPLEAMIVLMGRTN